MEINKKRMTVDAAALKIFARGLLFCVIDGFPAAQPFDGHPALATGALDHRCPLMSTNCDTMRRQSGAAEKLNMRDSLWYSYIL